ncbi:MAG TPA: hypothetical protein VHD83_00650 [Puia sp.]|nr:hypothetical protein [Puia sp.]
MYLDSKTEMSGYPQTLVYFMWPYQVHFLISCKVAAEYLFKRIDNRLQPTAFLLGFKTDGGNERPSICYEPEKMEFLADDFLNLDKVLTESYASDPLKDMYYSGLSQKERDERASRRNFQRTLKVILDNSGSFTDKIHFIGPEIIRNGYRVYVVLQLNRTIYSSYQFLHYVDAEEMLKKSMSFLDSVIDTYLEDRTYRLHAPDAGNDRGPERDEDELLKAAAKNFSYTIAYAAGRDVHELFPACEMLSKLKYEGRENLGHLIVCRGNHPHLEMTLQFEAAFPITEYRKVRKLLEMTTQEVGVVTNGESIKGLGLINKAYDGGKEDVFHIHFRGLYSYEICHQELPLLTMHLGSPEQVRSIIVQEKFAADAARIFPAITQMQVDHLYNLSMAAGRILHGSMLVFAGDAAQEAKRLSMQCIPIRPTRLSEEELQALVTIDGALIIDLDGNLHATGVILDGVVGIEGDASRGSRYNSALTYQEYRGSKLPTMIVVVSEDGMVDTIPQLRPMIRHSEIVQFIKTLESLNTAGSFNDQAFYDTMKLLSNRAFYLTKAECEQINALKKSLGDLDIKTGKTVWRVFSDLEPDPRMNPSYYIKES